MSIFHTLFVTLADNELAWGPGGGAPEAQDMIDNRLRSDEHPGPTLGPSVGFGGRVPKTRGFRHLITVR